MSVQIDISSIDTADRLRTLDPDWVDTLADDIVAYGQMEPIRVVGTGNGFKLIKGARRIAALLKLGRTEVRAEVVEGDALKDAAAYRLEEIKATMLRGDLTALDRAHFVATWKSLFDTAKETGKRGRKVPAPDLAEKEEEQSAMFALSFSEAAQRALSLSRRSVFLALKIARIEGAVRSAIALHPVAKNQRELLLLADLTPVRQRAVCDLLIAEAPQAVTVTEAIALLDQTVATNPVPAHERIYERFVRLKPSDREKFYALNRSEIEAWLVKTAAKKVA
ncbi:hypothetical protein FP2506_11587 [Fulvimarina pelagi HTCC2506]|uniref:ParB-like N-terminal domain-containing protein n=1 Tax=Fulvimarina pelagi HTCC2506 TaxID=314231 RepID=Q0FYW2_9HYPH|nr:ParB N-terminal domain-containing protein [Fulvimarina pelagi]EAU40196.1 hypothetical protein FP2506_11587 [Fulvimarina pelagi HTCC2506]